MAVDKELLFKAAKVYEAAEAVEGMKPKEVYESHKKCTPGEFGMNKEGEEKKAELESITPPGWDPKAGPLTNPPDLDNYPKKYDKKYWDDHSAWIQQQKPQIDAIARQRGIKVDDSMAYNQYFHDQLRRRTNQQRQQFAYWKGQMTPSVKAPAAAPPAPAGGLTIQQRLDQLNAARRAAGGEVAEGSKVVGQVDKALAAGARSTSPFPGGVAAPTNPVPSQPKPASGLNKSGKSMPSDRKKKKEEKTAFEKSAIPSFGGRNFSLAPRGFGLGLNAGYDYLGGVVPNPYVGVDIGTPHTGVGLSGPIPGISFRSGFFTRPPGPTSGPNRNGLLGHRSLWKYLADSYSGRDPKEVENELFADKLQSLRNVTKDELHEAVPYYHTAAGGKPLSKKLHSALTDYYHDNSRDETESKDVKKKEKKPMKKAASAFEFGSFVKTSLNLNPALLHGLAGGGGLGALAGGLYGFINPGEETDENGKRRQRSRFGAALRGALGGGALGAAGGAALGHLNPNLVHDARRALFGKQVPGAQNTTTTKMPAPAIREDNAGFAPAPAAVAAPMTNAALPADVSTEENLFEAADPSSVRQPASATLGALMQN